MSKLQGVFRDADLGFESQVRVLRDWTTLHNIVRIEDCEPLRIVAQRRML